MSGYEEALKAAGATVWAFKEFGSWQGDWWAKVTYKGKRGWVHDYFGSCSGCDSFQAEFDYGAPEDSYADWKRYNYRTPEEEKTPQRYRQEVKEYRARLADFGRRYLDDIMTQQEAEKKPPKTLSGTTTPRKCWRSSERRHGLLTLSRYAGSTKGGTIVDYHNHKAVQVAVRYLKRSQMVDRGEMRIELLPAAKGWAIEEGMDREELREIDRLVVEEHGRAERRSHE